MNTTTKIALVFAFFACFGLAQGPAKADATEAQAFVQKNQDEVSKLLRKPASQSRDAEISKTLDQLLDYDELSKRALEKNWDSVEKKKRDEFVRLLHALVEKQHKKNLKSTLNFDVKYLSADGSDDVAMVKTEARSRKNKRTPPVQIDYSLHRTVDGWRVYDIATDGVSLVENYNRQFRRIIRKDGFDGLLERMNKKLNEN
ncbi:MAG: ABC transporter substrate-binding protein [Polyangiales bacterium]